MSGNYFTKRIALSAVAFAVVAVGGIASVSIIPALAAGVSSNGADTLASTPAAGGSASHPLAKRLATRHIALALFRTSVEETGLSRITVLKDLLSGETFAQIDGSKAQSVESAVMAKVTTRIKKALSKGKITQAQATALTAAATAGISKLMTTNLSTDIRASFGGFGAPSGSTPPSSTASPAATTGQSLPL